jgi:hypothetical protein
LPAAQVQIVGRCVAGAATFDSRRIGWQQLHTQCIDDMPRDLLLDGEDVFDLALESLRPEVKTVRGIDELRGDPQSIAALAYAAFQERLHIEQAPHFPAVHSAVLQLERCRTRGDPQAADCAQGIDDLLRGSFAEIVLILLRTHVCERQDRDPRLVRGCINRDHLRTTAAIEQAVQNKQHDYEPEQDEHRLLDRAMEDKAIRCQRNDRENEQASDEHVEPTRARLHPLRALCGIGGRIAIPLAIPQPGNYQYQRQASRQQKGQTSHVVMYGLEGLADHRRNMKNEPRRAEVGRGHAKQAASPEPVEEFEIELREFVVTRHRALLSGECANYRPIRR